MRFRSSFTTTLGVWKPPAPGREASFYKVRGSEKKHSSSPSPANQIFVFHFFTQKGKSARGSSNDHSWLVNREPLVGSGLVCMLIFPIHATGNDPQRLRVQCPRSTQRCPNMQGNGETSRSPLAWQQFVGLEAWDLTITWSKIMNCGLHKITNLFVVAYVSTGKNFKRKVVFQASCLKGYSLVFWGVPFAEKGMAKRQSIHLSDFFLFHWPEISVKFPKINPIYIPQSLQQIPIASCPLPNVLAWWASIYSYAIKNPNKPQL